jgi:hypothetical protein
VAEPSERRVRACAVFAESGPVLGADAGGNEGGGEWWMFSSVQCTWGPVPFFLLSNFHIFRFET